MPVLQIRLSDEEYARLSEAAKGEKLAVAAFARGILFPSVGKPLTVEQIEDVAEATVKEAEKMPFVPIVTKATLRPGFKRHHKCTTDKCERWQSAACDYCRQANAKGFSS